MLAWLAAEGGSEVTKVKLVETQGTSELGATYSYADSVVRPPQLAVVWLPLKMCQYDKKLTSERMF